MRAAISLATRNQYHHSPAVTDLRECPIAVTLTVDSGWRDVADTVLARLEDRGL